MIFLTKTKLKKVLLKVNPNNISKMFIIIVRLSSIMGQSVVLMKRNQS